MCPPWERMTNNSRLDHWSTAALIVLGWSCPSNCSRLVSDGQCLWSSDDMSAVMSIPNWVIQGIQVRWIRWPVLQLKEVSNICLQQSIFTCQRCHVYKHVTSLTCIQFRLFVKEYLTHWQKISVLIGQWASVIFAENFCESSLILWWTVVRWWYIKLCAIFSGPLCIFCIRQFRIIPI